MGLDKSYSRNGVFNMSGGSARQSHLGAGRYGLKLEKC